MVRRRVARVRERVKNRLVKTFLEKYSPKEVAFSFSVGVFITMLPTLGVGVLVLLALAFTFDRLSKIAMFASVVVFNPVVKWGVYVASVSLGFLLLGPVEGMGRTDVSLDAGPEIVARLLVGNLILAIVAAIVSYVVVYRLAVAYRTTVIGEIIQDALEETVDEVLEP